ncbi:sigma 54-interacting transcriptional regulator [Escherichia coli]
MEQVRQTILLYARSSAAVLIEGETGTGKELAAQANHRGYFARHDARQGKKSYRFVAVNCGAIAESLLEAELFGYEEGAFTGSRRGGRAGLFEIAHGGTLFLDEIGEMPTFWRLACYGCWKKEGHPRRRASACSGGCASH